MPTDKKYWKPALLHDYPHNIILKRLEWIKDDLLLTYGSATLEDFKNYVIRAREIVKEYPNRKYRFSGLKLNILEAHYYYRQFHETGKTPQEESI